VKRLHEWEPMARSGTLVDRSMSTSGESEKEKNGEVEERKGRGKEIRARDMAA